MAKRATAYHVQVQDLLKGKYVKSVDELTSNFVEVGEKKVTRANIIGFVVDSSVVNNQSVLIIDDGSSQISCRVFEQSQKEHKVGEVVNVIGTIREFDDERYLLAEIICPCSEKWMHVRAKQFPKKQEITEEKITPKESSYEGIIDFIRKKDQGEGVEIDEIVQQVATQEMVENMLKEGELFKNRPGRVKVLE